MSNYSSIAELLSVVSKQTIICMGIPIFFVGILGGLLNSVVFLSLRTFRHNSCAFYLTAMSLANIGQLLTGLFTRLLITVFSIDWTVVSISYCKFRWACFQFCVMTSLSCLCLATIDQFLATCSNPRWQQWSDIKVAHRFTAAVVIVWILHGIPFIIFYSHSKLPMSEQRVCTIINTIFQFYSTYAYVLILAGFLPVFIMIIFGYLAYRNARKLAHQNVPLVHRELDKQLSMMVLVQVVYNFFAIVPYLIVNILMNVEDLTKDPIVTAKLQFAFTLTLCFYYSYFASPFYIYICVSERFRRQFIYVVFDMHRNRWRLWKIPLNQVAPQ